MTQSNQLLSYFEDFLRGIVREGIKEAQIGAPTSSTQPRDRIGGVALATEVTGLAKQTIYNLAHVCRIPHAKRGRNLIFKESELREWLTENKRPMAGDAARAADKFIVKPSSRRKGKQGQ